MIISVEDIWFGILVILISGIIFIFFITDDLASYETELLFTTWIFVIFIITLIFTTLLVYGYFDKLYKPVPSSAVPSSTVLLRANSY